MSSIATFYKLSESKRDSFDEAQRTQKTVTQTKGFFGFGSKQVVTGERALWEYLDAAAESRMVAEFSGFGIVDYLFVFTEFPAVVQDELATSGMNDGHYYVFNSSLASGIAAHLTTNPPDENELRDFAAEQGQDPDQYAEVLNSARLTLGMFFGSISATEFGVLHLTF